jgi:DNA replication protein DnaC
LKGLILLNHPTIDQLQALGLHGMVQGFRQMQANPQGASLDHAEWLAIILDHEVTLRRQKRFESRARSARLRHAAAVEDVDFHAPRGLDRALFLSLATLDWIKNRRNLIITGPCGVGKSWLASALGQKACREDIAVRYHRTPRLFAALDLARGDGTYAKLLRAIAKAKLLILDDWGPEPLTANQRRDLLEIIEDRYDAGSILMTSQVPVAQWYDIIGEPTLADAILDRLIHNAQRIELTGESLRKKRQTQHDA